MLREVASKKERGRPPDSKKGKKAKKEKGEVDYGRVILQ